MKKNYSIMTSGMLVVWMMLMASFTFAQNRITGKVSDGAGNGVPGATVLVKGTNNGTSSDASGNFAVNAAANSTLVISSIGFKSQEVNVGSRSVVNLSLEDDAAALNEVVVTGYQTLRKKDITGAVTVVNADELKSVKSSSFIQNLAGRASGLTTSTSGSPGDATNVRIRGISSFTSNDPLYIIDGVPVLDKFQNLINPNDIESVQVLKDASTASIYGSRASNGVIVVTTKQGKAGKAKVSYNGSVGVANPVKGYDEILNTDSEYYAQAIRLKFQTDAANTPWYAKTAGTLGKYVHSADPAMYDPSTYNALTNPITELNQTGTNWWKEITRTAKVQDHSLNVSGGSDVASFNLSASYFTQEGIFKYTDFNRGTVRANSKYKIGKMLRVGENLSYSANWGVGLPTIGGINSEFGIIGSVIKSTPVVPLLDIKGNPGGHRTAQTGNFSNPDQQLFQNKDNLTKYGKILGNLYAELEPMTGLVLRTSFGVDNGNGFTKTFFRDQPYRSEGTNSNNFNEQWNNSYTWTWTNTAQYSKTINDAHTFTVLAGQEAISNRNRNIGGSFANYFTTDVNAWYLNTGLADPASRSVNSSGSDSRLASLFGKVDYSLNDKYLLSATVRRDGSSKFTSAKRYGIFPAVSLGWRVSSESFMKDLTWMNDLKIRASYGELGNQQINNYNFASIYGGSVGGTFYDINGANSSAVTGYALTSRGNEDTQWETSYNKNIGVDAAFLNNSVTLVVDVYSRLTKDLLYNPNLPGTAGGAAAPFINVASMLNNGFDVQLGYRKNISNDLSFNSSLTMSHYKNEIKKVANTTDFFYTNGTGLNSRLPNAGISVINKVGYPISSFNGYTVEGIITTEAERTRQAALGANAIGGLKFKDINGDGIVDDKDISINGNPHPKLTGGLNLGVDFKNFDINAFIFGSLGNEIFTGYWIQSYFMNFNANTLNNILENQGTGTWPKINQLDRSSSLSSDFYIQDGSYLRLTNLQLGYKLPKGLASKIGASGARVYVQGQNLLTLTKYFGVDPAVSNANIGSGGGVNDGGMGLDNGNYPTNKMLNLGINLEF